MTEEDERKHAKSLTIGMRVFVTSVEKHFVTPGTVRFKGKVAFDPRNHWIGIELDTRMGRHAGSVNGKKYFDAEEKSAIFVRPKMVIKMPENLKLVNKDEIRAVYTKEMDTLKKDVLSERKQREKVETEHDKTKEHLEVIEKKHEETKSKLTAIEEEHNETKSILATVQQEHKQTKQKLEEVSEDLKQKAEQLPIVEEELKRKKSEIEEHKVTIEKHTAALDAKTKEHKTALEVIKEHKEAIETHKKELKRKEIEIEEHKITIEKHAAALDAKTKEHKTALEVIKEHKEAIETHKKAHDDTKNRLQQQQAAILDNNEKAHAHELKKLRMELEKERKSHVETKERLNSEHDSSMKTIQKTHEDELKKLRMELEKEKKNLIEMKETLKSEHNSSTETLQKAHEDELKKLRMEMEEQKKNHIETKERLNSEHDSSMKSRQKEHEDIVGKLKEQLEANKKENSQLEIEKKDLEEKLNRDKEAIAADLQNQLNKAKKEIAQESGARTAAEAKCESLLASLASEKKMHESEEKRRKELEIELSNSKEDHKNEISSRTEAQNKGKDLENALAKEIREHKEEETKRKSLEKALSKSEQDCKAVQAQRAKLDAELKKSVKSYMDEEKRRKASETALNESKKNHEREEKKRQDLEKALMKSEKETKAEITSRKLVEEALEKEKQEHKSEEKKRKELEKLVAMLRAENERESKALEVEKKRGTILEEELDEEKKELKDETTKRKTVEKKNELLQSELKDTQEECSRQKNGRLKAETALRNTEKKLFSALQRATNLQNSLDNEIKEKMKLEKEKILILKELESAKGTASVELKQKLADIENKSARSERRHSFKHEITGRRIKDLEVQIHQANTEIASLTQKIVQLEGEAAEDAKEVEVDQLLEVDEDEEEPETEVFARLLGNDMKEALNEANLDKSVPSRAEINRLLKVWLGRDKVKSIVGDSLVNLVRATHKEDPQVQAAVDSYNATKEEALPIMELNMGHEIIISAIVAWIYVMIGGMAYWNFERPLEIQESKESGQADPGLWRPQSAAFFALTVVSTIGYGATAPKSPYGRAFLVPYAILGIPIFNYFLSRVSTVLNKIMVITFGALLDIFTAAHKKIMYGQGGFNWFMAMTLVLETIAGLALGAYVFVQSEEWNFLGALYFSFVTVSTIGFGDMIPTTPSAQALTIMYIIIFQGAMGGFLGEVENFYGLRFDEIVRSLWGTEEENEEMKKINVKLDEESKKMTFSDDDDDEIYGNLMESVHNDIHKNLTDTLADELLSQPFPNTILEVITETHSSASRSKTGSKVGSRTHSRSASNMASEFSAMNTSTSFGKGNFGKLQTPRRIPEDQKTEDVKEDAPLFFGRPVSDGSYGSMGRESNYNSK